MQLGQLIAASVGNNMENREDDVVRVKDALARKGMLDNETAPEPHGFITREMDEGIKRFQINNDLKVDGLLYPNGETENALVGRQVDLEEAPVRYDATGRMIRENAFQTLSETSEDEDDGDPPIPERKPEPPEKDGDGQGGDGEKEPEPESDEEEHDCSDLEVEWINADAALFIAQQNLDKAEEKVQKLTQDISVKESELEQINEQIRKEFGEKTMAASKGAVYGGSLGAILGSRFGLGSGLSIGSIGMGVGSNIGKTIEELDDLISSDSETDATLKTKRAKLEQDIANLKNKLDELSKKINNVLSPAVEEKRQIAEQAKTAYVECKRQK